jgi:hypothetical protein
MHRKVSLLLCGRTRGPSFSFPNIRCRFSLVAFIRIYLQKSHVVLRHRNGAVRDDIHTSPIHFEYTTYMRGIDVANQLCASYSCQTQSHKWLHWVLYFLHDTTVVNMYIIYLSLLHRQRVPSRPMTHLQFKTQLCQALLQNWLGRRGDNDEE